MPTTVRSSTPRRIPRKTHVFVSFDFDRDRVLRDFVIGQARNPDSPFNVTNWSLKESAPMRAWLAEAERRIARCDVLLVMVGPQTYRAPGVRKEIALARRLGVPVRQVIGYRDTSPKAVPPAAGCTAGAGRRSRRCSRPRRAVPLELPERDVLDQLERQLARYQAIIARLAISSTQVKTWCVTALGALVALAVNRDEPRLLAVGVALVIGFYVLDCYYLVVERHFRDHSARLVDDLAAGRIEDWTRLAKVEGPKLGAKQWRAIAECGKSLAVSPFYAVLALLLAVGLVLSV
jgi:hypothetical protein